MNINVLYREKFTFLKFLCFLKQFFYDSACGVYGVWSMVDPTYNIDIPTIKPEDYSGCSHNGIMQM